MKLSKSSSFDHRYESGMSFAPGGCNCWCCCSCSCSGGGEVEQQVQ